MERFHIALVFSYMLSVVLSSPVDTVESKCSPDDEGKYLPSPGECFKFFSCHNGELFEEHCPHGTAFNPIKKQCDSPQNVPACSSDRVSKEVHQATHYATRMVQRGGEVTGKGVNRGRQMMSRAVSLGEGAYNEAINQLRDVFSWIA